MTFSDEPNLSPEFNSGTSSYSGIGAELRVLRERHGQNLEEVARSLRISFRHLQSIEDGSFEMLPGPAYVVGFLRSYSDFLGADSKDVVDRFKTESAGFAASPHLSFPAPTQEGSVPRVAIVIGSLVIAAVVFGVWYFWQAEDRVTFDAVPPVPKHFGESDSKKMVDGLTRTKSPILPEGVEESNVPLTAETDESTVVAIEAIDIDVEEDLINVASETSSVSEDETGLAVTVLTETGRTAQVTEDISIDESFVREFTSGSSATITGDLVVAPAEPTLIPTPPPPPSSSVVQGTPHVYGIENVGSRVTLIARQDSWVQVQSPESGLLITRILYSGDSYRVPDLPNLTLITGNAGGLEVLVDGEPVSQLGPEGAVRRNIPLDPGALRGLAQIENQ